MTVVVDGSAAGEGDNILPTYDMDRKVDLGRQRQSIRGIKVEDHATHSRMERIILSNIS